MKMEFLGPDERAVSNRQGTRLVPRGEVIAEAGAAGPAWRVTAGIVRLERVDADGAHFAGLALTDDVFGVEVLLYERHDFRAVALTGCRLEAWPAPGEDMSMHTLLALLAAAERRRADLLSLRQGQPIERVRRLLRMLAGGSESGLETRMSMPRLTEIADMTDLAAETVSRAISALCRQGVIERVGHRRARVPAGALKAA